MLGQVFGHFRVVERIGSGGMGVVYLAHDQHLDRSVALKVLPTVVAADATPRRRFRQEAMALSRLNHPNIAVVHDFDTFGDVDVLVMEYVPGTTLSERVHAGPLPETEVLDIGVQLASGLEAAHAHGIVHRDLKPSNLRLTPDGHLKILDFGLARLFEGNEAATTQTETDLARPPGTLAYMAPELLKGHAPMPASDIYAAGITLYELATGSTPLSGPRAVLIDQILNQLPEPPQTRSSEIRMAHRQLARVFGTPGNRAKSLEHLEKAFELRAHVSVRERYFIEAAYYNVHERYDDAVESLSLLAALYPDDFDAQYELATVRSNVGEIERAIQATREMLRIQPQSLKASELLVLLLAFNNQEGEALDDAQRAIAALGATAKLRWGTGMALMGLGRLDDARRELTAVEASGTGFQGIGRLYLTRIDLLAGQLDAASPQLVHDIDDDHRLGRTSAELLRRYLLARVYLLRGQSKDAREQAVQIAAAPASVAQAINLQHAALVFVQVGDLAAARGLLQRLDVVARESPSSGTRSCVHQVRGLLALAERQVESALSEFQAATELDVVVNMVESFKTGKMAEPIRTVRIECMNWPCS